MQFLIFSCNGGGSGDGGDGDCDDDGGGDSNGDGDSDDDGQPSEQPLLSTCEPSLGHVERISGPCSRPSFSVPQVEPYAIRPLCVTSISWSRFPPKKTNLLSSERRAWRSRHHAIFATRGHVL